MSDRARLSRCSGWSSAQGPAARRKPARRRRLFFEGLEPRIVLASTASLSAGDLLVAGSAVGEQLSFSTSGTNLVVTDATGITAGAGVTQVNSTTVHAPLAAITGLVDVDGGDGTDSATFGTIDLGAAGIKTRDVETVSLSAAASVTAAGGVDVEADNFTANGGATLSTRRIASGDPATADSTASSGDISIVAHNITIQAGSRLLAQVEEGSAFVPGKVTLKIDNSTVALPFIPQVSLAEISLTIGASGEETVIRGGEIEIEGSLTNDITSPKRFLGYTDQTVEIAIENASLEGESVSVVAESEDKSLIEDLPEWVTANFIEPFGEFLVDKFLPKTPISAMIRGAKATVSVLDSEIQSEGDVTLTATSIVDASTEAVAAYDEILKIAHRFSAGYSQATSTAKTTIGGESLIQAGGDVTITTDTETTAVVNARTTSNINLEAPASARDVVVSFAITNSNSTSQASLEEDASIVAAGNVAIQSQGTITNNATSGATTYIDGAGGLSVSLAFDNSDIQSTVDGRIQAGGTDVTRDVVLADISGSRMTIPQHGFHDGDIIRYLARDPADPNQPQDPIGGLLSGEELRVIVVDENTIELARTTALDLDNAGADPTSTQSFSRRDTVVFNPQTAVDPSTDQITLPGHGFTAGQQLDYGVGIDENGDEKTIGEAIGGLVDQTAYFAIPTGVNTFRVAATQEAALAPSPIAIDLTSRGSGTTHIFAYNEAATPFSPSADFDGATDTFTVPGHGFATGDALVYATDSSRAQQSVLSRSAVFNPTDQTSTIDPTGTADLNELVLNISTDTLALVNHGLATGDEVTYHSHDGDAIGGLTDGANYFVIRVDGRYIQLAATPSDASHAVAIDLAAGATIVDGPHTLTTVVAPRTMAFDPTSTVPEPVVNTVSDTVLITPFHNYVAGQRVQYQTGGGSPIGGLSNNHYYFAIPVTEVAFRLAASRDDALAGVAIDLTAGATGTGHQFTTNEVDTIGNLLVSPGHEMETGERVTYSKGDGVAIAPLYDGAEYYVIRLDANTVRLANSLHEASVGAYIDLLSTGSGTMQGLQRATIVTTFDPTRTAPVVDTSLDTIELPGHGLNTGDEVNYQASGGVPIGGLADNANYFAIRVDANHIQLAVDATAAAGGTAIPLAAGATLGSGLHAFRVIPEVDIAEFPDRQIDFDPTLIPALNTAADTIRLPNHGFSTADAVSYLSGGGTPIGGLTNGAQYFVIAVDDDTLQLAVSAAAANAGTAIPLSGGATGARHGLQRGSTITQGDAALRGLTNAGVYFAVVLDANTFRLTAAKQDALAAAPLALDPSQATGAVHELEPLAESSGILVAADLTADNRANAGAGIGGEPSLADLLTKAELQTSLEGIKGILNADFQKRFHNPAIHGGGSTTNSLFSGAAGIGLNLFEHTVLASVGATAEIVSGLDFVQRSTVTQASQVTAQGNIFLGSAKKFATGVAVALGFYTNDVQSIVDGDGTRGAVIDAPGAIDISSELTYPLLIEPLELLPFSSFYNGTDEYNVIGDLASFLDGSLGLTRIMNVWAASSAYTTKADDLPTVAISGSVGYTQYANTSQAIVRSGARLNQNGQNDDQQVRVAAATGLELVSVTGIMYLFLNERGLRDAFTDRDAASTFARAGNFFSFFGNKSSTFGMGGSAMVQVLDNTTTALIEGGAAVSSGVNGGLEVVASQEIYSLEFAQSGGDSGSIGISGSIVWVDQTSHTVAQLASGVQVTGGPVSVTAEDQTTHTSLAGSAQLAKRLGIGVGFALLDADRTTLAIVGKQRTDDDQTIGSDGSVLNVSQLELEATSTGRLWSFGLVGALASNIPTGSPAQQHGQAGPVQATSGVALAGDAAVNTVTDTTQAYLNDGGAIRSGGITLKADDDTRISTVTGAGALSIKPDGTIGGALAGSFSYNDLILTTEAFVAGPTIEQAGDITLDATSAGYILAVSGGLAGALAKTSVVIAGSFSWNEVTNNVRAFLDRTWIQQLASLDLTADDTSTIQADAGAAAIAISRAGQGLGGAVAFGVSAAINNLTPTVQAYVTDSRVTAAAGVALDAESQADITAITWAGDVAGAASGTSGLEGTFAGAGSGNTITSMVQAQLLGDSDVSTASGGDITLTATDTPDIEANAGGIAFTVELNSGTNVPVAIGAAASFNEIRGGSIQAGIQAATVTSGGALTLEAHSDPEIDAQSISLSVGAAMTDGQGAGITLDGAGAGAGNEIGNTTEASITGGSTARTTGTGNVSVSAADTSKIKAVAPAISLAFEYTGGTAFSLLVGISITSNEIANTLKASVDGSTVVSAGHLAVTADSTATSRSVPVAAVPTLTISQASSISLSGVGAHAFNTLTNDVEASLTGGSQVETAGDVNVTASDDSTIVARVVAASITVNVGENAGGNVAIDAALATNKIGLDNDRNTVRAFIQDSTVTAAGVIDVSATSTPKITGLTVGTGLSISATNGVSFGVNGFGARTTNSARQTIEAAILGTSEVSTIGGGKITVEASESDDPQISAQATGGSLSGSFSGSSFSGAVTVGVVLTDNNVGNQVAAHIDQASVTSSGDIELDASSTTDVESLTVFVSLSIAIGSTASFAAVGDGANSINTLHSTIEAYVLDSDAVTTTGGGSVLLNATDHATVNAQAGGGNFSLGIASSFTGSIAVAVVLARNDIQNTVQAYVEGSTIDAAGDVRLVATSQPEITALTVAVALAGSGTAEGLAAAGAAAASRSTNRVANTVQAFITASHVTAGGEIHVNSSSTKPSSAANIHATAPTVSVGISATDPFAGVAFALTGAGGKVKNHTTSEIQAFIDGGSVVAAQGAVQVAAQDTAQVEGEVVAVTVALSEIAGSIAVALVTNTVANDVQGYIGQASVSSAGGAISVTADASPTATATAIPVAISVEASGAGAKAKSDVNGSVAAYVAGAAALTASTGVVNVQATSTAKTTAEANGGGGSLLLTISALLANASIGQTTQAYVSDGAVVQAAGLSVLADAQDADATANVLAVSVGTIASAGGQANAVVSGDVLAFVGPDTTSTPPNIQLGSGTLTVQALAESTTAAADASGGSGGLAEVSVLVPVAKVTADTKASVGEGTTVVAGALTVDADANLTANATSLVAGIAALTGDGVNATAEITGDSHTAAFIGPASGSNPSGAATAITLASGDANVTSTLTGQATTDISLGSGGILTAADGTVVNSAMSGVVEAYLGDNVSLDTGAGDVTVQCTSTSGAEATSFGLNVSGIISAFGTKTTATLNPTLNAYTGSGVTLVADDVQVLAAHNVDSTGAGLTSKTVQADGTAGSNSLGVSGAGADVRGTVSPTIDTRLGLGTTVQATGTVTVASDSYQYADVNAHSENAALLVTVGVTLATGTVQGSVNTHVDGSILTADSVSVRSTVTAEVDAFGEANGGSLGLDGEGTNVQATVGGGDVNQPLVKTSVSGSGQVAAAHTIEIQSLLTTDAEATSSGYAFAGVASVGSLPATATVQPVVRTLVEDGAQVVSAGGDVRVVSGHNYDPQSGQFLSDKQASVSTNNTTGAILVSVADTTISAEAKADVGTVLAQGATVLAVGGQLDVEARSSNLANAHLTTAGGAIAFVGIGDATGTAHGTTTTQVLADIGTPVGGVGARNVSVVTQAADVSNGRITQHGGGGVSVNDSDAEAESKPTVSATVDGVIRAASSITVDVDSFTDADANIVNSSGGVIDVTDYHATVTVTPTVSATIADQTVLAAGSALQVSVNHGIPAADLSDGTFDAATQVSPSENTISFSQDHGLQTGARVTYDAMGQTAVGGLTDGRSYGVIVTGDKSLQLGDSFSAQMPTVTAPAGVNVLDDTIVFASPHSLDGDGLPATSDRVIYTVPSGSTPVGGLQDGHAYLVSVVDPTTLRLVDANAVPAAPQRFAGTAVGVDAQTITLAAHGFVPGQNVTYIAPAAAVTSSYAVDIEVTFDSEGKPIVTPDPAANNIYLGADAIAEQGFRDGDTVIYTAGNLPGSLPVVPIGGLVSGNRYIVLYDPSQPNQIQLADPATPATPIELDPTNVPTNVSQTFLKVDDQPIGGLVEQQTYYAANVTPNTFQLAPTRADALAGTNIITLDPTDPLTGTVLTGTRNTLGTRGVDLTDVGGGQQHLVIDITSTGSGTQQLIGIGGAAGLADAPSGDGIATASVSGGGGGVVSVETAATTSNSTPNLTLTIGQAASLTAGSVVLSATSAGNVSASADNNNGGFVAVSEGRSSASTTNNASVVISNLAQLQADDSLAITTHTSESATTLTDISSSGFAGIPTANSKAHVDYTSKIDIQAATLTAGGDLTIDAQSSLSGDVTATADGSGVGSGSDANDSSDEGLYVGSSSALTQASIANGASLTADALNLKATVTSVDASANATATGGGLGGNSNATARMEMTDTTEVVLNPHANLLGNQVNLASTHNGIIVKSMSNSRCDCFGGADNSIAKTDYESYSKVDGQASALISTSSLTVSADQNITTYERDEKDGGGFLVFGDHDKQGEFNAYRDITWNATVGLPQQSAPQLVVDGGAVLVVDRGVSVVTDTGQPLALGDTVPEGRTIVVEDIANDVAGSVVFEANELSSQDGKSPPSGTISGSQGVFEFQRTFANVEISNASTRDMQINGIEVFLTPDPNATEIEINVQTDSGFSFDVVNDVAPTTVTIENTHPTAAPLLILNGVIDNPIGPTTITNASGDIVATGSQAIVRTNALTITAPVGNIGQTGGVIGEHRVNVQLVQSAGLPTALQGRAGGDHALSVQALLRETGVSDFRPQLDLIAAGHDVDLWLLEGLLQTTGGSAAVSTNVWETARVVVYPYIDPSRTRYGNPPLRVTPVVDHWPPSGSSPTPVINLGLQGSGTTTIATTYEFTGAFAGTDSRRLQAGRDIRFQGCGAAGCAAATSDVSAVGNVVLTDLTEGVVHGNTNGVIDLTEIVAETANRALRVGVIESTGRWVRLTVPDTAAAGEDLTLFDAAVVGPSGSRVNAAAYVTLDVGDNVLLLGDTSSLATSSQVNAGTTVVVSGDRTAPDPDPGVGSVIDLRGRIAGNLGGTIVDPNALQQVGLIQTGTDADIVSLTNVAAGTGTTVQTGEADDRVQAGSQAAVTIGGNPPASWDPQNTDGVLHAILDLLTVDGGAGADFLSADDSGDAAPDSGVLTFSTITGFHMPRGIVYGAIEDLVLTLGQAGDILDVDSTNAATNSQVFGNPGNDTINVAKLAIPPVTASACVLTADTVDCILGALRVHGDAGYDTLNVIDTGQTESRGGLLTGTTITGLNMGPLGIEYQTLEVVDILLGQNADHFTVAGTAAPQADGSTTISAVHGGGGQDALLVQGGGGPDSPLVLYGDYTSTGTPDIDYLDASASSGGVTADGNEGADTILGSQGDDNLAGSAGADQVGGQDGDDNILGDSGFEVDLQTRVTTIITTHAAARDTLSGEAGDDALVGDHGVLVPEPGQLLVVNPTSLASLATANDSVGDVDLVTGGPGNDILVGGQAGDLLFGNAGDGLPGAAPDADAILGDNGQVLFWAPRRIASLLSQSPSIGGEDQISSGADSDYVIAGVGGELVLASGGQTLAEARQLIAQQDYQALDPGDSARDVVIGDNGEIRFDAAGNLIDAETHSPESAGADQLVTGNGPDVVLGGTWDDVLLAEGDDLAEDLAIGDNGRATFGGTGGGGPDDGGTIVSFNFFAIGASTTVTGAAGAGSARAGHWNNLASNGYTVYGDETDELVTFDNGDPADGISIAWGALYSLASLPPYPLSGALHYENQHLTGEDAPLFKGVLYMTTNFSVAVDLAGLAQQFTSYDLYVYVDAEDASSNPTHSVRKISNGTTSYYLDDPKGHNFDGTTYVETTSTDPRSPQLGNYVVFRGLTADTASLRIDDDNTVSTVNSTEQKLNRPSISGIQIVGQGMRNDVIETRDTDYGGDDIIRTGGGADIAFGGSGADDIQTFGDVADETVDDDVVIGDNATARAKDGKVRDIQSTAVESAAVPAAGDDDTILTGGGDDFVLGGNGRDWIDAGSEDPNSGHDADLVFGDNAQAKGVGTQRTEVASIGLDNGVPPYESDTILAGADSDVLVGGNGEDDLRGGGGGDAIFGDNVQLEFEDGQIVGINVLPLDPYRVTGITLLGDTIGGQDRLEGGGGNDLIYGQFGDDRFVFAGSGLGADVLAEAGNGSAIPNDAWDHIDFSGFTGPAELQLGQTFKQLVNRTLVGGSLNLAITLSSATAFEMLTGTAYGDTFSGNARPNWIDAGEGDNTVHLGSGPTTVLAGSGDDAVDGGNANYVIRIGDGDNQVHVGNGANTITTGNGNDTIVAGDGGNIIDAGGGTNSVRTGRGVDRVTVGDGSSVITTDAGNDVVLAGNGKHTISTGAGHDEIRAGDGDNNIDAGDGDNLVITGKGRDTIVTGSGNDVIRAGDGANSVKAGSGDDTITTGDGPDVIDGNVGNDLVHSGGGADVVTLASGNDIVVGGSGDDKLYATSGRNLLIGGDGADLIDAGNLDDILIACRTTYDDNDAALLAILKQWLSSTAYLTRINAIRSGPTPLNSTTVLDDTAIDTLFGRGGSDWFFASTTDQVKDLYSPEVVDRPGSALAPGKLSAGSTGNTRPSPAKPLYPKPSLP